MELTKAELDLADALREAGVVDTHYHVGPELLPRRYDVRTLAAAAAGMNAVVALKNHTYSTTPLAALARSHFGVRFLGGVVLNRFVGGLNPDAVMGAWSGNAADVSHKAGEDPPVVVWMPTVHAASHLQVLGHAFDPRWAGGQGGCLPDGPQQPVRAFDENLRPLPELLAVLEAIARTCSVLATGHLSAAEIMRLVPLAIEAGIRRVIVTHPHYPSVALSEAQMCDLVRRPEVFLEHCFAIHTIEAVPLADIAAAIRATGPDQTVLSTDFGQVCSAPFPYGTLRFAASLAELLRGAISRQDLVAMFSTHGAAALGLTRP